MTPHPPARAIEPRFWRPACGMIGRLWGRRKAAEASQRAALPAADPPVCVIGDLHGRDDLLAAMIARLEAEPQATSVRIVTLGDMIDRGPASQTVLHRLRDLEATAGWNCLMGNHERMMLDFLADPVANVRWLRHGGAETMASFGCTAPADRPRAAAVDLTARLGDLTPWIAARPLLWQDDGLVAAHAGTDPHRPLSRQTEQTVLWARPPQARPDVWTIHGHIIVPEPIMGEGLINVDTGAWRSGRLSAVWIDAEGPRLLTVTDG